VTTTYQTNPLNQYTQVGPATYAYDADGNRISRSEGGVTTVYSYDALNRPSAWPPGDAWEYRYDAFGNRKRRGPQRPADRLPGGPAGWQSSSPSTARAAAWSRTTRTAWGWSSRSTPAACRLYYDFDALGSTAGLSGPAGTYVNRHSYLPFGEPPRLP
jgi:uncharacterized protein RhaS with RHS repeats